MSHLTASRPVTSAILVPLLVLVLAIAMRAMVYATPSLEVLANVSALPAIAFASGYLLRRWWAPLVVVGTMAAVDAWIDSAAMAVYWPSIGAAYVLLLALGLWGMRVPGQVSNLGILGRSAVACAVFYGLTNSISWLTTAGYGGGFFGWVQALTVGLPGFRPTWSFGLQMLASTMLFTAVILLLFRRQARWSASRQPEAVPARPLAVARH